MQEDPNADHVVIIDCPKCKKTQEVKLLSITNHEQHVCPACKHEFNLGEIDSEAEDRKRRNLKEFDKLRKLLDQKE